MALSVEDLRVVSALLDELLDVPAPDRPDWLAQRTDIPDHLRSTLRDLATSADDTTDLPPLPGYGDSALAALDMTATSHDPLQGGAVVGPYRLLRELGQGGMGSVWLAERVDGQLRRQVALKLPHSLMTRPQLRERLLRERDFLAQLVHPHIARLYDAGVTEQGQPFLALEYVQGQMLTDYCKARSLDLRQRLVLFLQVLDAVQYAHGQLIVHRDLKPTNLLVTEQGQVRLLDFGIAKLLVDGQAQETELTQLGGRALTPQYAAPEQILGQTVGIAADIYALGVILYELLTGTLPYRLARDSRGALEDAIVETVPVPPSRAPAAAGVGLKGLRGDLDTIALKALKKNPGERYATAAAFADDIQRYLRGDPVLAQADSFGYRTRRFVGRHRWAVAAAVTMLVSLVAGLGVATWQASVARREARTANAVKDYLRDIFLANSANQPNPQLARQTTARELLDIGAGKIDASLTDAPAAKLEVLQMVAELYTALGMHARTVELMERHLALARAVHGNLNEITVESMLTLTAALWSADQDNPRIGELLQDAEHALDQRGENTGNRRSVQLMLAADYFSERDVPRALAAARRAAQLTRAAAVTGIGIDDAAIFTRTAKIEILAHNCPQAQTTAEEGIRAARLSSQQGEAGQGGAVMLGVLHEVLGLARACQGDRPAAIEALRSAVQAAATAFGEDDLEVARFRGRLASLLWQDGRTRESLDALALAQRRLAQLSAGDATRMHTEALASLGRAWLDAGQPAVALQHLQRYLQLRPLVDASPRKAEVLRTLALVQVELGDAQAARAALDQAVAMRERAGLRSPQIAAQEKTIGTRIAQGS